MHTAEELLTCLRHETDIARRILEELDRQHKALLELDLAGLEASTAALEEAAGTLRAAEEQREAAARVLAGALEVPAETPLREILGAVPAPARAKLEEVRTELRDLIEEMHHRNYANYILMLNAARYNRAILQFVSGTSTTYSSDGAAGEAGETRSVVLNKKA